MTSVTYSHVELWQHPTYGDVYAVVVDDRDGTIRYGNGPLTDREQWECMNTDPTDIYDDPDFDPDDLVPWGEQHYAYHQDVWQERYGVAA